MDVVSSQDFAYNEELIKSSKEKITKLLKEKVSSLSAKSYNDLVALTKSESVKSVRKKQSMVEALVDHYCSGLRAWLWWL